MPATDRSRTPNDALRALLAESGWTQAAFAHRLALLGAEEGLPLRYDRTSVAHWLRGSRPAPAVQRLMAEALSRRLGRPVPVSALGMAGRGGPGRRAHGARPGPVPCPAAEADAPRAADPPGTADTESPAGRRPRTAAPADPPHRADETGAEATGTTDAAGTARTGRAARAAGTAGAAPARPGTATPGTQTPDADPGRAPGRPHGSRCGCEPAPRAAGPGPRTAALGAAGRAGTPLPRSPYGAPGAPAPDAPLAALARLAASVPGPLPAAGSPSPHHAGVAADAASVREHLQRFTEQADRHGGGPVRAPLAAYVAGLTRRLRTGPAGRRHRELLVGAARLSCLLARVYADEQRHGLARRAFLTADGLAREAGDAEGVALARRALSSQAHQLGRLRYSAELARAACAAAPAGTEPSARAFLYAGLAVAEAPVAGRRAALDALARAERELARADALGGEPVGGYPDAALRYQAGLVRAQLGDRSGAVTELRSSLRARPVTERRARALSHAELAEVLLSAGRLDEACAAWRVFLEECSLVRSGRARHARARMATLVRPYRREPRVRALLVRSGAVVPAVPER
ncbi:hypothetical protein [Streptomyces sp. JJ36]|uniref:hypothetical protein n=1 Tax=Streptomyces sp. JJ36 TaxID=2736645 RepID=UPI001F4110E9|nr:hypothetical protein [Streptomyces sp. JJ36]MCF6523424.1 hypothetical protein [Streptomyces sp. JJ36]